jgi:hypothetical protein
MAFVARSGSGILEPVSLRELDDYLEGGEYAQRLQESDQMDCYWDAFGDEDEIEAYYDADLTELVLVQCLAALLITPAYSKYSAETLFEMMKRSACQTGW